MRTTTISIRKIIPVLAVVACLFFSCNTNIIYSHYQHVPDKIWDKSSELSFSFYINDPLIPYTISLQLRNSNLYPYRNLWLFIEEQHPTAVSRNDTIEFQLAEKPGKWKGNGISLFQNQLFIRNNYHFPDTGSYQINIKHGMQDDLLPGIEDVGLLVEKVY